MLPWLLSAVFLPSAFATDAIPPDPQACSGKWLPINLTPSGYYLPLTSYAGYTECNYNFNVPVGYYAKMDFHAYNIGPWEAVNLMGSGISIIKSNTMFIETVNYTNSQTWAMEFAVYISSTPYYKNITSVQVSLNITLLKATPTANIVKSYVTFPGASSVFFFNDQWNEGESYKFTSKTGNIYIKGAVPSRYDDDHIDWGNVLIYDDGILSSTLNRAFQYMNPLSTEVIFYCTKKINTTGVLMVTDYSNVKEVMPSMKYIHDPDRIYGGTLEIKAEEENPNAYGDCTLTVITPRDNPYNYTIVGVRQRDSGPPNYVSYLKGGPIQNHSNAINITGNVPVNITGYANTFYLAPGGYDAIYYDPLN